MDINVYPAIKKGLEGHLLAQNYIKSFMGKTKYDFVVGFEPSKPKYPFVKVAEQRNVPNSAFSGRLETVASLGYRIDIYAKTDGESKQDIARSIMKLCNDYMTCIGLRQVSHNEIENDGLNGDLYHIILLYNGNYLEQRQTILI